MSCYYIGYSIVRQLILKMCSMSKLNNKYLDINEILNNNININSNNHDHVFNYIKIDQIKIILCELSKLIDNRNYETFLITLLSQLDIFKVTLSNYNDKIKKYTELNNNFLNKQLKNYINNESVNIYSPEYKNKKILTIISEVKEEIIIFDCIEDGYIN